MSTAVQLFHWLFVSPSAAATRAPAAERRSSRSLRRLASAAISFPPSGPAASCRASVVLPCAIGAVFVLLTFIPYRATVAPLVESDYAYQFIAVDRLFDGHGLTSLQRHAPHQPWEYQYDWGFLTQWPVGYPLGVAAVRWLLGCTTLAAAQWLAAAACAAAGVGWAWWIYRALPAGGVAAALTAALGATCGLKAWGLIQPSTDIILTAALPYVLMLAQRIAIGVAATEVESTRRFPGPLPTEQWHTGGRRVALIAVTGLLAGGLFWIRYAALFVPVAVGLYLLVEWRRSTGTGGQAASGNQRAVATTPRAIGVTFLDVCVYSLAAAAPIAALLTLNSVFGPDVPVHTQLNLGVEAQFNLSWALIRQAWSTYTDLGLYDYRPEAHPLIAIAPAVVLVGGLALPAGRRRLIAMMTAPPFMLGSCMVILVLATVILATACFGDKYPFVTLDRYYLPVRPFYIFVAAAPLLMVRARAVRMAMCVGLLIGLSWMVRFDWGRSLARWDAAGRERAPSGAWAAVFTPGAAGLYRWLEAQGGDDLIVFSNFHDYIALETGAAAYPIPPDRAAAGRWIDAIAAGRGVSHPRVWFVLDPDNRHRDYFLPPPGAVINTLQLTPIAAPAGVSAWVLAYDRDTEGNCE